MLILPQTANTRAPVASSRLQRQPKRSTDSTHSLPQARQPAPSKVIGPTGEEASDVADKPYENLPRRRQRRQVHSRDLATSRASEEADAYKWTFGQADAPGSGQPT